MTASFEGLTATVGTSRFVQNNKFTEARVQLEGILKQCSIMQLK